jgi:hypothetical protein
MPILGPSIIIMSLNDLPPKINTLSQTKIFPDDTRVIICGRQIDHFCSVPNTVLSHMSK